MNGIKEIFKNFFDAAYEMNNSNILDLMEEDENSSVLDLGCDEGSWTAEVASRIRTKDVTGVEIVESRAKVAEKKGIKVVLSNLNDPLPFDDASFDVIHANQVIEHISDLDNFIGEIRRILKPGGYVVVSTENGSSWHNIFAALMGWQIFSLANFSRNHRGLGNPLSAHRDDPRPLDEASWTHKTIFNYRGLLEFFEFSGFENVKVVGAGYTPLPPSVGKYDPRHAQFITLKAYKK